MAESSNGRCTLRMETMQYCWDRSRKRVARQFHTSRGAAYYDLRSEVDCFVFGIVRLGLRLSTP